MNEDYGTPWVIDGPFAARDKNDDIVFDTQNSDVSSGGDLANAGRIVACVNFLAGVPSDKLAGVTPLELLLLRRFASGDPSAAVTLADAAQEQSGGVEPIGVGDVVMVCARPGAVVMVGDRITARDYGHHYAGMLLIVDSVEPCSIDDDDSGPVLVCRARNGGPASHYVRLASVPRVGRNPYPEVPS